MTNDKTSESKRLGQRQVRCKPGNFRAIEENDQKYIEGYFAVFDGVYEIAPGMTESLDPHCFDDAITGDVRMLTDHETRLVLGRTTANTLSLSIDSHGLYGRAPVNPNDQDAMNTLARIDRGDVSQASFGFDILDEEADYREDGSVHWTIKKVKLYEISVCTFPAYQDTDVKARASQRDDILKRKAEAWRTEMMQKLKNTTNKEM